MVLLSIGTFLCALSFAFLAICLAVMLRQSARTLNEAGNAAAEIESLTDDLVHGVERTLLEADRAMDDLKEKMDAADTLVASAGHMSDAALAASDALNMQARKLAAPENLEKVDTYVKAIEWSEVASRLYRKWKVANMQ